MLRFIAENAYIVPIMGCFFIMMYMIGGEDIIFFRKKHYAIDPKANEKLDKALAKYARGRDYKVMGRTTLSFNGQTFTFDGLLLTYFGVIGFTAVPHAGDIYGDAADEEWVAIYDGKRTPFYSPVMAMNGSVKVIKDIFRTEKVKGGQTEIMAVFTNNDANVAVARSLPACHVSRLSERLTSAKLITDNGANIEAMKAALEKYAK